MKKIEAFSKEIIIEEVSDEKLQQDLESMTNTTTRSQTIPLVNPRRSSSLMRRYPDTIVNGSQISKNSGVRSFSVSR